jgi:Protein of unknown function (DUF3435)
MEPQLRQVMNHRNARTYQAYINKNIGCDTQSASLGRPSQQAIIDELSTMGYRRDCRAPTELTGAERDLLKNDESILRLRKELTNIKGSVGRARNSPKPFFTVHQDIRRSV